MSQVVLRRPVRARAASTALFLALGTVIGFWAACIPAIKLGLTLSDAQLGLGLLAFAGGAIVAMPVAGWLGVRFGSQRVAVAACWVLLLGLPLPGVAPSLPWLIAAALLIGAANGVADVTINAHATAVERAWGRPIMSSFHAAFSLGGLVGASAGGALLAAGLTAPACLSVAAVLVAGLTIAAVAAGLSRHLPASAPQAAPAAFAWPSRAQLGIGLLTFLALLIEGAMVDWSGVFLVSVAGASMSLAAAGYAAFSVAMVACRLLGDGIVDRLGEIRVLRLGAMLAACGLGLALGVARPAAAGLGFALVGIGVANMIPVLFSAAGRTRPNAPSVGVAMAATLGYAGFLLGPPIIGLSASLTGLRAALLILPVAALIVALVASTVIAPRAAQARAKRLAT